MIPTIQTDRPGTVRIDAAAVADAALGVIAPASVLLRVHRNGVGGASKGRVEVLAVGEPSALDTPPLSDMPAPDRRLALPDRLLMPALVNAHAHLDLSHLGPMPHDPNDGFVAWVERVRAGRRDTPEGIAESVRLGVELSVAGGTVAVGDVAGAAGGRLTDAPARVLASSPLAGVSFLEFFGIGRTAASTAERLERFTRDELGPLQDAVGRAPVRVGWQPHAPNTVDLGLYRWAAALAARHGLPLATHLAETPEERAFIAQGDGPQRDMLERFGLWDDSALDHLGKGKHPVEHLASVLRARRVLCAHVNDATDQAIETLAETHTPVAYCPRASAYFGAEARFGPHRYRDMLEAGVPVCLGTDSIVNLDRADRISVLDEMRLLHRRDGTDASTLLRMATTNGAEALGLNPEAVSLRPGPLAGLLAAPVGAARDARAAWEAAMAPDVPIGVVFLSRESF